ncbi:MAG: putative phosphatase [Cellvibrionales bacterium UBA7375]|nr:HAD-IB family hydrolase [Gammaproteobacteria bacterium]CAI8166987.1 MAG: putative phosphatase [Cellvibrionales bacterium UBA7375]
MALAIFDLDNTLIAGDSDHSWGEFLVDQNIVDRQLYKKMNDKFYADYESGCLDIFAYLEFSVEPLTQFSLQELDILHQQFMRDVIEPMKLDQAETLINHHRQVGDRVLVITSTNRFIVEPICKSLGINEIIATDLQIIDGKYTGKVDGTPTFKEGKVERFNQWLKEQNTNNQGSYFYSDSINDMPMLLEVTYPIAVDPDPALRKEAESRHWEIISLRN